MALKVPFSKSEVNRAGELLREWWELDLDDERGEADRYADAADLLFRYREGFQVPLKKVTVGVRQFVVRESAHPVFVAQRLKRAPQIVAKLSRFPKMKLARMQDIGGCRAILGGGQDEVNRVLRRIRRNNWDVRVFKNYVEDPAPSGYRAIHVVVMRDDHLIEIQLRTPRQHQWAEAVERTALRTRLNLKEGDAPEELLEYFAMAAEGLALEERGVEPDQDFDRRFAGLRRQAMPYFIRNG